MSAKRNLTLDLSMFGAFLALTNPHVTGNTIHEWLGVSLAAAVLTHLLLHWTWILKVGKEFFKKLFRQSRLNFVVNVLFFITMTGSFFSGLLISESVLSTVGMHLDVSHSWRSIHSLFSEAAVIVLGVHLALHWKWILTHMGRYIVNPIRSLFQRPAVPQTMAVQPAYVADDKQIKK